MANCVNDKEKEDMVLRILEGRIYRIRMVKGVTCELYTLKDRLTFEEYKNYKGIGWPEKWQNGKWQTEFEWHPSY